MISNAANLVGFSVTFIFLNTLFVGLRLLSRRISAAMLWWDDAFIIISLVGKPWESDIGISKFTQILSYGSYTFIFIGTTQSAHHNMLIH